MNKYTESDYKRMHQAYVEDIIDMLLTRWHHDKCPLTARVCRNLASQMEGMRHSDPHNLNVWVSAANEEWSNKPAIFKDTHTRSKS